MNFVTCISPIVLVAPCCAPFISQAASAGERQAQSFIVRPIGHVEKAGDRTQIVLDKKYQPGLLGVEGFSHVYVFWFDKNDTPEKRAIPQVHPRGNLQNPLTGVFATRSPVRPNLIALTLCEVVSVKENVPNEKPAAWAIWGIFSIPPRPDAAPGHRAYRGRAI